MLLAILLFAEAGAQTPAAEFMKADHDYKNCLYSEARSMEPSGANMAELFAAAKTACAGEWFAAYTSLVAELNARPASPTGKATQVLATEILDDRNKSFEDGIRLEVLRLRAARKRN